jgi:hypothetical protein
VKSTTLLKATLVLVLCAGSAFAQDAPNAPRRFEISYTGNPTFIFGFFPGFVRKGGFNLGGACLQVAVRATDSAAVVGEMCGTHQFVPQDNDARRRGPWPLSEPASQQVDSLGSIRGGVRLSQRTGSRMTMFVQGLAGIEWGYRHGGFADNSGVSLAAGGGVDISLTNWFAYEVARANFQTTRVGGTSVNSVRFGIGPVFRFGETTDQSSLQP